MYQMLTDVIVDTFEEKVGNNQSDQAQPKALKVSFKLKVDRDKENGYRQSHLLLYGHMNYVGVYIKETSDTLLLSDMEEQDGERVPKEGKAYIKAETQWQRVCYHDSEWRSAIRDYLWQNRDKINGFDRLFRRFYEVVDVPAETKGS